MSRNSFSSIFSTLAAKLAEATKVTNTPTTERVDTDLAARLDRVKGIEKSAASRVSLYVRLLPTTQRLNKSGNGYRETASVLAVIKNITVNEAGVIDKAGLPLLREPVVENGKTLSESIKLFFASKDGVANWQESITEGFELSEGGTGEFIYAKVSGKVVTEEAIAMDEAGNELGKCLVVNRSFGAGEDITKLWVSSITYLRHSDIVAAQADDMVAVMVEAASTTV